MVRALDQLTSTTIAPHSTVTSPFFSPDGEWVGFFNASDLALQRVSVRGGPPVPICEVPGFVAGASWGADDTIVFSMLGGNSGLWQVRASGGEPELLTTPNQARGELNHGWPEILPDGNGRLDTAFREIY